MGLLFKVRVLEGLPDTSVSPDGSDVRAFPIADALPEDVEHPLYMPEIDRALACHISGSGPMHIKLYLDWEPETAELVLETSITSLGAEGGPDCTLGERSKKGFISLT